jgi:hypothetical protein
VTIGVVNGPLSGARTSAEHLSWASIPGTRALPARIPRRRIGDTRDLARVAPPSGQTEMDLPGQGRAGADPRPPPALGDRALRPADRRRLAPGLRPAAWAPRLAIDRCEWRALLLCPAIVISDAAPGTTFGNHRAPFPRNLRTFPGIVFAAQLHELIVWLGRDPFLFSLASEGLVVRTHLRPPSLCS